MVLYSLWCGIHTDLVCDPVSDICSKFRNIVDYLIICKYMSVSQKQIYHSWFAERLWWWPLWTNVIWEQSALSFIE